MHRVTTAQLLIAINATLVAGISCKPHRNEAIALGLLRGYLRKVKSRNPRPIQMEDCLFA